jgi:hypothetical protein
MLGHFQEATRARFAVQRSSRQSARHLVMRMSFSRIASLALSQSSAPAHPLASVLAKKRPSFLPNPRSRV